MDDLGLTPVATEQLPAADLTPRHTPALRPGVGSVLLDDEAVLLDPATGASHVLDPPATLVTRFLDGRSTLADIAADIADVLGADREQVTSDVVGLARTLGAQGLLAGVARDPHAAHGHDHAGVPEGAPVGADLGGWVGWADVAPGPVLMVSWGTRCGFCAAIAAELADLVPRLRAAGTPLLLVTVGDEGSLREQLADVELPVLHVEDLPDFLAGLGTPVGYLVAADRTVAEPIAVGAEEVPALATRLVSGAAR